MSKALVIKGANFVANKVETVSLEQVKPCTDISVSPTSISFTAIGNTQQLSVTKTPVDTTDSVSYVSSNTDVVTVSESGLVTCVGVGTATVTVMCGEQSKTVNVTATHTVVLDTAYYADNGNVYSESMNLSADPPKNQVGKMASSKGRLYYSTEDILGGYRAFTTTANAGKYAMPLPKGATQVTITPPEGLRSRTFLVLVNTLEKQTYVNGADGNSALGIYPYLKVSGTSYPATIDISDYANNANGYIVSIYSGSSGADASTISGTTTLVFS